MYDIETGCNSSFVDVSNVDLGMIGLNHTILEYCKIGMKVEELTLCFGQETDAIPNDR